MTARERTADAGSLGVTSRRQFALLAAGVAITGCGDSGSPAGGGSAAGASAAGASAAGASAAGATSLAGGASTLPPATAAKSKKRGIAYNDLVAAEDFEALAPGVSWWYNWATKPGTGSTSSSRTAHGMDFIPMVWGENFKDADVLALLAADPGISYLLVLNEPNLSGQAHLTPAAAAALWPRFEQIAASSGVKLVGPQITWGNLVVGADNYSDPVAWLDAFYAAYRASNGGQDPHLDYLGFHWYDYGLAAQLDRLTRYGKPFWVTEIANWHTGDGAAQIDTPDKQMKQMTDMIATCEGRPDVHRYAWFTGRLGKSDKDVHYTSLLAEPGVLSDLGKHYVGLPFDGG